VIEEGGDDPAEITLDGEAQRSVKACGDGGAAL